MATSERGHDTAGLLAMLETAADPDQAGMMSPYAVAGMAQRAAAALSAAEAWERRLRETLAQSRDHLRGLMWDRMDFTEREIAAAVLYIDAALTEGERDG